MFLGTLALFVVSLGYGIIVPLLPELGGAGGAQSSAALVSVVYAAYAAAKIGAQVPGGVVADRLGPTWVIGAALTLFTLSLAGFLLPVGLGFFAVLRAVEGLATGLVYPAVMSLVLQGHGTQHAGKRIGTVVGVGTSGMLVGPALGGLLAPYGLRVPVAFGCIAAALVTALAWREHARRRSRPAAANAAPRTVRDEVRSIAALAGGAAFIGLILPVAFNKLTFSAFQGLLPLYGPRHLELGIRGVTALFALTGVCFALAQAVGGFWADRQAPRRVMLIATVPLLASLFWMSTARDALWFAAAWAAYVSFSSIIFTATLKTVAREYGSDGTYGGVMGVVGTLTDLMTIVGPLLFLNVYGAWSTAVFPVMAGCGVLFAAGFVVLAGRARPAPSAS